MAEPLHLHTAPGMVRGQIPAPYSGESGRIIERHMWATGLLS